MEDIKDIKSSAIAALKERLSSPLYGYFIISWLILNWKSIYTTAFISNESIIEKHGLLKIEYVTQAIEGNGIWNIIVPIIGIVFFVYLAPFVAHAVYNKTSKDKFKLKGIEEANLQNHLDALKKTVKKEIDLNTEKQRLEKKLEQQDPNLQFKKEFDDFKRTVFFPKFQQLIDCVYSHRGYIVHGGIKVDQDILAYAHSNELIEFSEENRQVIEFTKKGKFFVSIYNPKDYNRLLVSFK